MCDGCLFLSFRVKILLILRVCHEKLMSNLLLVKELNLLLLLLLLSLEVHYSTVSEAHD